jgi:asparagine synthase (glutamine-hydrolysing)
MRFVEHAQRNARGYGLEWRYPFLDADVMAAVMALPAHARRDGALRKPVLRRLLRGVIPDAVVDKTTTQWNDRLIRDGLRRDAPLLENLARDSLLAACGAVRAEAFARKVADAAEGRGALGPALAALTAEIWMRDHLGRRRDGTTLSRQV